MLGACGGDETTAAMMPDATVIDVGAGPDRDGDEWGDDEDNCPDLANLDQRDRDRDGIGDACDTCPSTPNNGQTGQVTQSGCDLMMESEPNDDLASAQALSLLPSDQLVAVRGTVEAPAGGLQARDHYQIMVGGQSLLEVRVARASPESLLEPAFEVSGGSYTEPRSADGLHVATRQIYFSEAGTYTIAIADRRGLFDGEPKGDGAFAYELSVRSIDHTAERVSAPFEKRAIRFAEPGTVGIFTADLIAAERMRVQLETDLVQGGPGLDPILILEHADGSVWVENHVFRPRSFDARVLVEVPAAETARIIIDYRRAYGDEREVLFTLDYPSPDAELEPNDEPDLATPLRYCQGCQTTGTIGTAAPNPDLDWFVFDATAGQVVSFRGLVAAASMVDPFFAIGQFDQTGDFVPTYSNGSSSGISSRIDAIFHESGTYYLGIVDEQNLEIGAPPFRGGPIYAYNILTEFLLILPAPELTTSATVTAAINPGGKLNRYLATVQGVTTMTIDVQPTANQDLVPEIRVYGQGAVGLIAVGRGRVQATLPSAGTYVVGVHNANLGLGGPDFTYQLTATFR